MIRRFVNLVEQNFPARSYSLHRLDVAKHLFYPSTADAEAANNAREEEIIKEKHNGGSAGDKPPNLPPSRVGTLRRLPPASTIFRRFPVAEREPWKTWGDVFALVSPRASEGRIFYAASESGHCLLHDAEEGAISTVPSLGFSMGKIGRRPIAFCVPGKEHESIYMIRSAVGDDNDGDYPDFVVLDFNEPHRKWQRLPPPPCVDESGPSDEMIKSFTVLDGGRTICVSSASRSRRYSRDTMYGTYCFDTACREWRHAGDWELPFDGRAEYVPELDTWLGFCNKQPRHLCAADLSAVSAGCGETAIKAPALQHVWEDFNPPPKKEWSKVLNRRYPEHVLSRRKWWTAESADLVNLGSGRFCTAKFFLVQGEERIGLHLNDTLEEEEFLVLTGVELVRGGVGEEEGGIRMVRHKSKRYSFTSDDCSIYWVL
ncbi:unnamed protein product [Urochloa humidicola]